MKTIQTRKLEAPIPLTSDQIALVAAGAAPPTGNVNPASIAGNEKTIKVTRSNPDRD